MITETVLADTMSYSEYRHLLEELMKKGFTTGIVQSEEFREYAKINLQRMQRLDKTVVINADLSFQLSRLETDYIWVVITEGWCGDAAQNIPVFAAIEKISPHISLRLILRDDHPQLMNNYLTNGARSIPKLICVQKSNLAEVFTWGPRPSTAQALVMELLQNKVTHDEKALAVQQWYNADKTASVQQEILELLTKYCVKHASL
jgi:hypothetical protein